MSKARPSAAPSSAPQEVAEDEAPAQADAPEEELTNGMDVGEEEFQNGEQAIQAKPISYPDWAVSRNQKRKHRREHKGEEVPEEAFEDDWQPAAEGEAQEAQEPEAGEEYTPLSGWWAEVKYDSLAEAERALEELQGADLNGFPLSVLQEDANKLVFENLPPGTDWRDLKDVCRQVGNVVHVDVHEPPHEEPEFCVGEIRYERLEDAEAAAEALTGTEFKGSTIRCEIDPTNDGGRFMRVHDLPWGTAWQALKDLFSQHGRVAFAGIEGEDYKGKGKGKKGKDKGKGKGKEKGKDKGKESRKGKKGASKGYESSGSSGFSSVPKSYGGKDYDSGKGKSKGKGKDDRYSRRADERGDSRGDSWGRREERSSSYRPAADSYSGRDRSRDRPRSSGASRSWEGSGGGGGGGGGPSKVFSSGAVAANRVRENQASGGAYSSAGRSPGPSAAPQYSAPSHVQQRRRGESRSRDRRPPPRRGDSRRRSRSRSRGGRGYRGEEKGTRKGGKSDRPKGGGRGGKGGSDKVGEIRFEGPGASESVDSAIKQFNGYTQGSSSLVVERDAATHNKVFVRNMPADMDWPQLKDMFRKAGPVAFVATR